MNFKSDNIASIHPQIMQAIVDANKGNAGSYGHDEYTAELQKVLAKTFEHDLVYYFASTGTASNCLALSAICPPYGTILCSDSAHILTDESTAPGFFTGGARLMHKSISPSKIDPNLITETVNLAANLFPHAGKPACVSIAQSTELGQVYTLEELKTICDLAHQNGLKVHMDGARFANALVHLGCTPAEMTWKVGVDVLTFGATKNGGLLGELIIFFDKNLAQGFDYLHKRAGQLMSKTRFFAIQMLAYLKDDLWLKLTKNSNDMMQRLYQGLKDCEKCKPYYTPAANELFVVISKENVDKLFAQGAEFYDWDLSISLYRFVTSWQTTAEDVDNFIAAIKAL